MLARQALNRGQARRTAINTIPDGTLSPYLTVVPGFLIVQCPGGARRALALRALVVPRWEVTKPPIPGGSHGQFTIRAHHNLADLSASHAGRSVYQFWLSAHWLVDRRSQSRHSACQCFCSRRLLAPAPLRSVLSPQAIGTSSDGAPYGHRPGRSLSARVA